MSPSSVTAASQRGYSLARPWADLRDFVPEGEALSLLSHAQARKAQALPLFLLGETVYVAVADSEDFELQDYLRRLLGREIEPVVAEPEALSARLECVYRSEGESTKTLDRLASQVTTAPSRGSGEVSLVDDKESPVASILDHLVTQAIHYGASDIHIESLLGGCRLRYRIDGKLHEFSAPPSEVFPALISRVKVLAHLDIAERRRPQDGRYSIEADGQRYDLRVSIIPYADGEGAVLRLLGVGNGVPQLSQLGFEAEMLDQYIRLCTRPHGILLVTGPTGAGKSTTLYATLRSATTPAMKVATLEDPVEYRLEGICQIPVRNDIGFGFAEGLRSLLRHDPDVVLVGEIRDLESAEIAIRAALTGHLLFSTLHTNEACQTVTRLVDMGLPAYKVLTSLIGVLAQRLVRKLCPECRAPRSYSSQHLASLGFPAFAANGFEPVGCDCCRGFGYAGRVPLYELLEITEEMRGLNAQDVSRGRLQAVAVQSGFRPFSDCAHRLFRSGVTSLEEIASLATLR